MSDFKVLHIIEDISDSYGGPSKSLPYLCNAMRKSGVYSEIWAVGSGDNELCKLYDLPVKGFSQLGFKYFSPSLAYSVFNAIRTNGFDIYHFHSVWSFPTWIGIFLCLVFSKDYVVSPRSSLYISSLENRKTLKKIILSVFLRSFLKKAKFIHTTDEQESLDIENLVSGSIIEIPHGIDAYKKSVSKIKDLDTPVDSSIRSKRVLFFSRIHPRKRLREALEGFQLSGLAKKGYQFVIAGPMEDEAYYKLALNGIETKVVKNNVSYLGMLDLKNSSLILSSSDIFLVPSDFENFGMAICEALTNGMYVIIGKNTPWRGVAEFGVGKECEPEGSVIAEALIAGVSIRENTNSFELLTTRYLKSQGKSWEYVAKQMSDSYRSHSYS